MLHNRTGASRSGVVPMLASGFAIAVASCLAATPACAQSASAEAAGVTGGSDADIIITASRIKRDGFEAPTPTTVIGTQDINKTAPANLADYVNTLPQLSGSASPQNTGLTIGGGLGGANVLNLRALGTVRTLTLLDGRRVVGAAPTGVVDVNLFPQALVSRVDVVTGGVSAGYGSDAVSGVVNFILDTKFTGLKADIQGGVSRYGDAGNGRVSVTYGTSFAGGRGHFIVSGMGLFQHSVDQAQSRPWYNATKLYVNPAWVAGNGQPYYLIAPNIGLASATDGGLITGVSNGAPASLVGLNFNPDGSTSRFVFGTRIGTNLQQGGTYQENAGRLSILPGLKQHSFYGRTSYDIADDVTVYAEGQYGYSYAYYAGPTMAQGNGLTNAALTIRSDNAYLPAAIAAQLPAGLAPNTAVFSLGRLNYDGTASRPINTRRTYRGVLGVDGKLGEKWSWNAYYQYGRSVIDNQVFNDPIPSRGILAADAVRVTAANVGTSGLAIGSIACRSTLTNPTNGCAPMNVFGYGSPSAAALAYITGTASQRIKLTQHVVAGQINGTLFSTWAGPVSIAAGAEHRLDKMVGDGDILSATNSFNFGNYHALAGSQSVTEGFAEVDIPLLSELPFAKFVDLDAALRVTDYSFSGTVKTYKLGLNWKVDDALTFRAVRSRDIRAPNLNDLFLGAQSNQANVTDPQNNGATTSIVSTAIGNTNLTPEIGTSWGAGAVYRPLWLPGFAASVDYYDIKIRNAIATVTAQQTVNFCALGQTLYCAAITRNAAGIITGIRLTPFNANSESERGLDIELGYRTKLSGLGLPGAISTRLFATKVFERTIVAGGATQNLVGILQATGLPSWRGMFNFSYDLDWSNTSVTVRYVGKGVQDNTFVEGGNGRLLSINDNDVPSRTYVDLSQTFRISGDKTGKKLEVFFAVQNLFNVKPPYVPTPIGNQSSNGVNGTYHDLIGTQFRMGARVAF